SEAVGQAQVSVVGDDLPCQEAAVGATPPFGGGCPQCGGNDGYLNIGRDHWFVCHTHRTKWCRGSNLFSSWRGQNPKEWEENDVRVGASRWVEPLCDDEAFAE